MKRRRGGLIGMVVAAVVAVAAGQETAAQGPYDLGVREHVFDNGLRLLVIERPDDPRVACKIFTDMGGLNETPGQAGAAHYLEHLMFKGTRTLGSTDWQAEAPIIDAINEAEADLIDALNEARNEIAERGVWHDYRHAETTPRIEAARSRIAELDSVGAAYRDNGAMMRWYQAYGGTGLTATTEQEYMKFDINLPANRVDLFLRVEADRMENTVFREFDQERMILVEQRLGDLNRPATPYAERMAAASGESSPVYWPEGHYPTDFSQYSRAYQRLLYERYFVVNNTTLVFIGGVTLEEMIPKVERWFGHMEPAPDPPRSEAIEPVPLAERRVIYRSNDLAPRVEMRHAIPGVGHPDRPHFDVLAGVLEASVQSWLDRYDMPGRASANFRVIHTSRFGVPSTLNLEIVLPSGGDDDASIRSVDGEPTPTARQAAAIRLARHLSNSEEVILAAIRRLADGEMPETDLALTKKTLRTQWFRTAANADALAFEIGHFQTMDRWQTLQAHLETRETTSTEDIARLVRRYFVRDNRIVGIVRPPQPEPWEVER